MAQHVIEVTLRGGRLVPGRYDPRLVDFSRQMPGVRRWTAGVLTFVPSRHNLEFLQKVLPDEKWTIQAKQTLEKEQAKFRAAEEAKFLLPGEVEASLPYRIPPYEHQLEALALSKDLEYYAYLMEMGTGKTKLVVDLGCYLYERGEIDAIFTVAPGGVDEQWVDEGFPNHLWSRVPYKIMELSTAAFRSKKEMAKLAEMNSFQGLRCFTLNCEALSHNSGIEVLDILLRSTRSLLVIDEASKFRNPRAERSINLAKVAQRAPYRRILTGTSIVKGVENLYSQFRILHPEIVGSASFSSFKNEFCQMGGFEGREIVSYKNLDTLHDRLRPFSYVKFKADCLDLPPKIYTERVFSLNTEERAAYKTMREEMLMLLSRFEDEKDPQVVFAAHGAVSHMKLSQISRGFMFGSEETQGQIVWESAKPSALQALDDTLAEMGDQSTIIWTNLRPELDMVSRLLTKKGIAHYRYSGSESAEVKRAARLGFKAKERQVFLGQTGSGGLGLDFPHATLMIYYSHSGDAEIRWQSEDRAHRGGQTQNLQIVDLIAKGTRDKHTRGVVDKRDAVAKFTLKALREQLLAETI